MFNKLNARQQLVNHINSCIQTIITTTMDLNYQKEQLYKLWTAANYAQVLDTEDEINDVYKSINSMMNKLGYEV